LRWRAKKKPSRPPIRAADTGAHEGQRKNTSCDSSFVNSLEYSVLKLGAGTGAGEGASVRAGAAGGFKGAVTDMAIPWSKCAGERHAYGNLMAYEVFWPCLS
jgi:hypothetical protein